MAVYQMAVYQDVAGYRHTDGAGERMRHKPQSLSVNGTTIGQWSFRVARHAADNSVNERRSGMPAGASGASGASGTARRRSGQWWSVVVAIVAGGVVVGIVPSYWITTSPARGHSMPSITTSGNQVLRGGDSWWLLGYNSFTWSGNCGSPAERMSEQQVDDWFGSMRHDGHGAVRLMFFDNWSVDRLDNAIAAAERNNIYVTITLDNALPDCGEDQKTGAWFADDAKRKHYAEHMTELVERYRGTTTIAWFEYFNEPGYFDGAVRSFYDQMGSAAKAIDPDRLFSSGTIAPYSTGGAANFRNIQESPAVDISSMHEYDYDEAESHLGPGTRAASAGKPVVVGEFGVIDAGGNRDDCIADVSERVNRVRRKLNAYLATPGYAGAFAWAWQPGKLEGTCLSLGVASDAAVQAVLREAQPGMN